MRSEFRSAGALLGPEHLDQGNRVAVLELGWIEVPGLRLQDVLGR
jgi:hypothetical protein